MFWGMQFRTCKNFWAFADNKSSLTPKNSYKYKSHTAITSMVASLRSQILRIVIRVANRLRIGTNLIKICNIFRHTERSEVSKSCDFNQTKDAMTQNSESYRFAQSKQVANDSQVAKMDSSRCRAQNDESLDLPKQFNESCDSTPNLARFVVQKIGFKGAVVPPTDFLLEKDLRGSPPKSEKAAAFWRVGGAGRGVQPFLRKEIGESKKQIITFMQKFTIAILCLFTPLFANESFEPNTNHSITIVSENDAYFEPFIKSDEYYTAGHYISYLSPEFADSWVNKIAGFAHIYNKHFSRFSVALKQEIYTPENKYIYDFTPPTNDILFGAALYANLSFISRTRDFMEQFSLDIGVVGPYAFGKEVQNGVHRITHNREALGWNVGALKNEVLVNLHYGFIWRWVFIEDFFDVLPQFQISLGNAYTAASASIKFRVGYGIKNDFGAQKLKSRFVQNIAGDGLKIYAVFGLGGSAVGRDIFVEGNIGKNAPKSPVTINRFLYEIEVGAMIGWKYLSFGYIWSNESPRFREQKWHHKYGSLRLEIMF